MPVCPLRHAKGHADIDVGAHSPVSAVHRKRAPEGPQSVPDGIRHGPTLWPASGGIFAEPVPHAHFRSMIDDLALSCCAAASRAPSPMTRSSRVLRPRLAYGGLTALGSFSHCPSDVEHQRLSFRLCSSRRTLFSPIPWGLIVCFPALSITGKNSAITGNRHPCWRGLPHLAATSIVGVRTGAARRHPNDC
jgi:hypothetical protein